MEGAMSTNAKIVLAFAAGLAVHYFFMMPRSAS